MFNLSIPTHHTVINHSQTTCVSIKEINLEHTAFISVTKRKYVSCGSERLSELIGETSHSRNHILLKHTTIMQFHDGLCRELDRTHKYNTQGKTASYN